MGPVWGGGLCSAGPGETVWRHRAQLALGMRGYPHCSLTAEFCIGARVPHRASQLGAVSWAPSHTPSLPPHLAWHCPTPPTPACSRTIFQMDVSILLLVIKAKGQRRLAQLCTEGAGHSPDPPSLTAQGSSFPHAHSGQATGSCPHPSIPGWQQVPCPTQVTVPPGVSLEGPIPIALPASALPGPMLAAGWFWPLRRSAQNRTWSGER